MPGENLPFENEERRRFQRIAITVGVHCNSIREGRIFHALSSQSENLGAGGLAVLSDKALQAGDGMIVSFFLPGHLQAEKPADRMSLPVIARSRVAWCKPQDRGYKLGIEFLEINHYSRRLFKNFLDSYLPDESSGALNN